MEKNPNFATLAIHAGETQDKGHNAIVPPITTATSFVQENIGSSSGDFCYARCGNPTRNAYESALAALHGGVYATATASGMAATSLALELLSKDSVVLVMNGVYGGTHRLFEKLRSRTGGLKFRYLNLNDLSAVRSQLEKEPVSMVWVESPTNPLLKLVDIQKLSSLVKGYDDRILICVDNTFATAWNQRPLELGADIVMISTSKYIGGHSDLIGGALITGDPSIATNLDFLKTTVGAIASPFDAYLALRGMKSLDLRMERQCGNAQAVAEYLESHPAVLEVHYPTLQSHPDREICARQMKTGGAVVTIRIKGEIEDTKEFISKLHYFTLAESLGGIESMVNHSASMSHCSMSKEERESIGIYDTTLRLSIGAEDKFDLIDELKIALDFLCKKQQL